MSRQNRKNVVVIGCGNLAWHLVSRLYSHEHLRISVYNRSASPALSDLRQLGVDTHSSLSSISRDGHYYLICVSDAQVAQVAALLEPAHDNAVVLHCSGSLDIEAAGPHPHRAVLYPLQTFSRNDTIEWEDVPLFITHETAQAGRAATQLAALLGGRINVVADDVRHRLHLAAVVASNFTNALYGEAFRIAGSYSRELVPLILRTAEKLKAMPPAEAQTGPARRNDLNVMMRHMGMIEDPEFKKLYAMISRLIMSQLRDNVIAVARKRRP